MTVLARKSLSATSFPFSSCKVKSGALSLTCMRISPGRPRINARNGATLTPGTSTVPRILHRGIMVVAALAVLACSLAFPLGAFAQEERPQIMPRERLAPRKKDSGPRAGAVLRMAANGKTSVVPMSILTNNKFGDATSYQENQEEMALDFGTVYEGEQ